MKKDSNISYESSLENICRLLVIARVIAAGIGLSAMVLVGGLASGSFHSLAGLLLVVFPLSIVWWLLLRLGLPVKSLISAQLLVDLVLISGIVWFTGGARSYFTALYLLTIFISGVLLTVRTAYLAATLATVLFAFVSSLGYETSNISYIAGGHTFLLLHIVFQASLFYLAAFISGHSAERIRQIAMHLDITNLELARARNDVDLIIQSINSGLVTVGSDGVVREYNEAAERILKLPAYLVKGKPYREVFPPISQDLTKLLSQALESGREEKRGEVIANTRDGRQIPLGVSISLLSSDESSFTGVVVVFQDLTDAKRMEEHLRRADRLAALGELAAAIAHEIRTPLASICGSIEMLSDSLDGEDRKLVELVVKESERLRKKIDYFLEFARSRPTRFEDADIGLLLREVLCLVRNHPSFTEDIDVELKGNGEIVARVDEETIKQVFYNLAINAVEAMGTGGRLSITVEAPSNIGGRPYTCVKFEDNGTGIDNKDLEHIFEPFFTRKECGTGLGLAIAARIVEDHGGWIDVESKRGEGTKVSVYLPTDRGESGAQAERLVETANLKVE